MIYPTAADTEARVVARVKLPLVVRDIARLGNAVLAVYGPGCTCRHEPPYWMTFYKPETTNSEIARGTPSRASERSTTATQPQPQQKGA